MKKERVFFVFGLLLLLFNLLFMVSAQGSGAEEIGSFFDTILETTPGRIIFTIVFGIGSTSDLANLHGAGYNGASEIIIFIATWFIMLLVIKDLITIFSTFEEAVSWVVAAGLMIIIGQLGWILGLATWFASLAAIIGAFAIWAEIIIVLVVAFGVAFGAQWAAKWAAKRKFARQAAKADVGALETADAIEHLRKVEGAFGKKKRGYSLGG